MLRWVSVSPDGKRVAYQALGYICVRDLPERRAAAPDHADRPLRVLPVLVARLEVDRLHDLERRDARLDPRRRGRRPAPRRVVTDKPGHYVEPVFSPDGSRIVYRKDDGRLPASRRPGPPTPASTGVPAAGGKSDAHHRGRLRAALRQGDRPRLLRQDRGRRATRSRPAKRVLASIELDGSDAARVLPLGARAPSSRSRPTASGSRSARASTRTSRRSSRPAAASTSARRARPCR